MAPARLFFVAVCVLILNLNVDAYPKYVSRATTTSKPEVYPFDFFSRADWGGSTPTNTRPLNLPVPYVVIHHTYVPAACYSLKKCASDMKSMQKYHKSLGWGDIGYNFLVGSEGGAYEGRGWDNVGIHAGPANNYSIGICLIGDWRAAHPPETQLETVKALIASGVMLGKVREDYKLIGHRQAMEKTECPGNALFREISTWDHFTREKPNFTALKATKPKKIKIVD